MSKNTFKFTIQTPEGQAFSDKIISVKLRADNGQMQVMAHHASILATVLFSKVEIETKDGIETFMTRKGLFNFENKTNEATLLCIYAQKEEEMDISHAKDYLKFIEEQMASGKDLSQFQLKYLEGEKLAIEKQIEHK